LVVLDTGNFIARKNPPYGYDSKITLQSLQRMGYDVLAIGDKEISWGLDQLQDELLAHNLIAVSNNILDAETGETRFPPFQIVKAGHLKIGVTSAIGGSAVVPRTIKEKEGIELTDPIESSLNALKAMRKKKADVTVLIAHFGLKDAQTMSEQLSAFDVILVGHGGKREDVPTKEAGVILASTGTRSNWLGELTLTVDKRQILNFEGRSFELKQDDGPVDEFLKSVTWTKLELDEMGNRVRKAKKKDAAKATTGDAGEKGKVEAESASLDRSSKFLGGDQCAICHEEIHEFWTRTPHASAFQTVAETEDWEKPECWNCHVVGFGVATGHPESALEPTLWNVQCESCHGMGTEHARGADRKKVDEATCRGCHTKEWSPDFDYKKSLSRVACTAAMKHAGS